MVLFFNSMKNCSLCVDPYQEACFIYTYTFSYWVYNLFDIQFGFFSNKEHESLGKLSQYHTKQNISSTQNLPPKGVFSNKLHTF